MKRFRCWNCFQFKEAIEFYARNYKGESGLQTRCKACNNEVCRAWRARNTERKIQAIYTSKKDVQHET